MPRFGEQLMCEDGGEMLECHGRGETDDRRLPARDRQSLLDLRFELRQIVARVRRALVESVVLAAVDRFLRREALDFLGELGRSAVAEGAHAFDEKGLTGRESRR